MTAGPPEDIEGQSGGGNLPELVRQSVLRRAMFSPGQAVLVAVSGGADSTALLHVLIELSAEMPLRLGVAHLNHRLRGDDSAADADFVARMAAGYGIPCFTKSVDTRAYAIRRRLSLEDAGRRLRYRFLLHTARRYGYDRVAVGHHREDNAETVLMGLLRGSGATGLGGIAAVRPDGIVRPMIDLPRRMIHEYLSARGLAFVSDRSNSDIRLMRNKIRLELLPLLEADFNPNMVATLNRLGDILQQEDRWLALLSRRMLENILAFRGPGLIGLSLCGFNRLHLAARRRVFRLALAEVKGNLRRIGLSHVSAALQLAHAGSSGASLHLPSGIRLQRTDDCLEIVNPKQSSADRSHQTQSTDVPQYNYHLPAPGTAEIAETGDAVRIELIPGSETPDFSAMTPLVVYLDADCLEFPLTVRNPRPGDRFSPLGTRGTQKLKKFFCDHKTPRRRRKSCPLLLSGNRIIWVAGFRIDNAVKLTAKTSRVLRAELLLA